MKNKLQFLSEDYKDELQPVNPAEVAYVSYSKNVSLDQLVDKYLMQYEKEATGKGMPPLEETTAWRKAFNSFIKEAPGDAEQPGGDLGMGDPGAMDPGLDLGGDAGAPPEAPAPQGPNIIPPDIDIERFTELVYGLMQNYETLIDPATTIMNRAEAYVAKNYSPRHAEKLVTFLETKYGVGFKDRASGAEEHYSAGSFGDAGGSTVSAPET